jgi:hypothetical protein
MRTASGYSGALYNKPLLRLLVFALFLTLGCTGYIYLTQTAAKLGLQGFLDALAVYSFIIAAYLLILVAEVVDAHYLRALGALGLFVGCGAAAKFIFVLDGPHLESGPMGLALLSFIFAMVMNFAYLSLLVGRLFHGKATAVQVAKVAEERGAVPSKSVTEVLRKVVDAAKAEPVASTSIQAEYFLIGIGGPYIGQRLALKKGDNVIGRTEGDVILTEDKQASRKHCVLSWTDSGLHIRDLDSTNGTFVSGQRVTESSIAPGDIVGIGSSSFKIG